MFTTARQAKIVETKYVRDVHEARRGEAMNQFGAAIANVCSTGYTALIALPVQALGRTAIRATKSCLG